MLPFKRLRPLKLAELEILVISSIRAATSSDIAFCESASYTPLEA